MQYSRTEAAPTIWFTGLSGAGKTTLATAVYEQISALGYPVELLDGDVIRHQLWKDLGFSKEDRDENVRRLGILAELLTRHNVLVIVAAISPYRAVRDEVREKLVNFLEVYVNAPIEVCEQRDVKGHYRSARKGAVSNFTGVTAPYEPPLRPDVECRTDQESLPESLAIVMQHVAARLNAYGQKCPQQA